MTAEDERKNQQVKKLYVGVIILLIVMFIGIFAYSLNKVLAMEGSFPGLFEKPVASEIEDPATSSDAAIALLADAVKSAADKKPSVSLDTSVSLQKKKTVIDENGEEKQEDAFITDMSGEFEKILLYLEDGIEDCLENAYEDKSADFGEAFDGLTALPGFDASDIAESTCTYIYYKCASCGETSDTAKENCEACGYAFPYTMMYRDEYTVNMKLKESEKIEKLFGNRRPDEVIDMFGDELDGYAVINSVKADYSDYRVNFKVQRLYGKDSTEKPYIRITSLEYIKIVDIEAGVSFTGDYEALGDANISDRVEIKTKYSFTWPGITLSESKVTVEPGKSDNLLATVSCDNPIEYTGSVVWTSSDPDVVTVDGEGYYKGLKTAEGKSAVITASFEYNGITYSDSCEITVQVPVEGMSMSKRHVKLNAGETITLATSIDPKNATFKDVIWYGSSDESVATVDENGTVTALNPGVATVTAYSADGFYKSTCEVTVR